MIPEEVICFFGLWKRTQITRNSGSCKIKKCSHILRKKSSLELDFLLNSKPVPPTPSYLSVITSRHHVVDHRWGGQLRDRMGVRQCSQSCVDGLLGKGEATPGHSILSETGGATLAEPMVSC